MSKSKLIRYIKFRARCSTFPDFLTNLEQHPEHGPEWLQEMNSDPDVRKLMDLTINLWPRIAKQCDQPLIGVGHVFEAPSFEQKYGKYIRDKVNQEAMYRERVHVVEGKKSRGFMVTDPTQTIPMDSGSSSDSPINLDYPAPTIASISHSKSTSTSKTASTASKYTPTTKHATASTTTTATTTYKPTNKYDPKIDEIALREELLQQMMMPNQMRLVAQFKPSIGSKASPKSPSPSARSVSPSTSPSSSKTIKKEKQKSAPAAEPAVKSTISKNKPAAIKRDPIVQNKAPVIKKRNPISQKQSEEDLWKLTQKVNVLIERPQPEDEDIIPNQPVVRIVKRKPLHYGINDGIKLARARTPVEPKIRHPVVLIKKAPPRIKNPVVKIIKRTPIPYPKQRKYDKDEEDEEDGENENEQEDDGKHKRQKRDYYLYNQNGPQIVQVVIENLA
ncbi:hypothetical protein G6F42_018209 [Rhizopus arrhizus]|nr:hypothetical protein G6F42_018209 [Rhizopus arrhizus]